MEKSHNMEEEEVTARMQKREKFLSFPSILAIEE
jgi:hypothetical protein